MKIIDFFKKLFSSYTSKKIGSVLSILDKVGPLVEKAYPIVKRIAELTPNKTDDQILAVYKQYGVENYFKTGADRAILLRDLAKVVLIQVENINPVAEYILNLAVELAYAKFKEK